jgi:predicted esterase
MKSSEDTDGIKQSMNRIIELINSADARENYDHIFLGGFSMGGGLCLHSYIYDISPKIRGIFTLGSFVVNGSEALNKPIVESMKRVPLLMMHGEDDDMIVSEWGRKTSTNFHMRELDVQVRVYENLGHDIGEDSVSYSPHLLA